MKGCFESALFDICFCCAVVAAGGHAPLHGVHGHVSELVAGDRVDGLWPI